MSLVRLVSLVGLVSLLNLLCLLCSVVTLLTAQAVLQVLCGGMFVRVALQASCGQPLKSEE